MWVKDDNVFVLLRNGNFVFFVVLSLYSKRLFLFVCIVSFYFVKNNVLMKYFENFFLFGILCMDDSVKWLLLWMFMCGMF